MNLSSLLNSELLGASTCVLITQDSVLVVGTSSDICYSVPVVGTSSDILQAPRTNNHCLLLYGLNQCPPTTSECDLAWK